MRMLTSPKLRTNAAIAFLTFVVINGAALYGAVPTGLPDPAPPRPCPRSFRRGAHSNTRGPSLRSRIPWGPPRTRRFTITYSTN